MIRTLAALAIALTTAIPPPLAAQDLARQVARVPDGDVRLAFAARPGVYGNGRNVIAWDCPSGGGRCRSVQSSYSDDEDWRSSCDSGPVRVVLSVRAGTVTRARTYVGGHWTTAGPGVTDLGTVSTKAAADYLLDLARTTSSDAASAAIFAATLADSVTVWPELLRLARDDRITAHTRRSAVFWLGQAAGEAATRGLAELVQEDTVNREVREAAVFALSQRPREEGVPALIRVVRTNRDPEVRRKALFWLGQSGDPRALALFEELLTK
jgi:HEAT repeat protein